MLGQVVQLPDDKLNLEGMIFGSDLNIYFFTKFDHQGIFDLQIGAEVNFTPQNSSEHLSIIHKKLFHNYCTIHTCRPIALNYISGHTFVTSERTPQNVNVYESIRNYEVCGESISRDQALEEMIQIARMCGANAILGVNLQLEFNPVKKFLLYRYCGTLAQVSARQEDTSTEEQQNNNILTKTKTEVNVQEKSNIDKQLTANDKTANRPIQIDKNIIKNTSPNKALKLKLQLVLLVFILLFLPLCGQLILNYNHIIPRGVTMFFGIITCIMTFVIYINLNPHKNCGYIQKQK